MEQIFKRLPLTLGISSELREPGAYQALEVAGVPVLLTRASDGEIRAFVNTCSHRGAIIVPEGVGRARRFACPYHAWTYDQKGALVAVLDDSDFGDLDKSCHGLVPLPVAERAGLIFVVLRPDAPSQEAVDIDTFLQGYDKLLEHLGLEECFVVGRQSVEGPNWKVAYDGYLDFYHLPILHKDSFGSKIPNKAVYDAWGPHQRVGMPIPGMEALEAVDEDDWPLDGMTAGVWTIFPHISVASFDAGGKLYMMSQLFPGSTPDDSVTNQIFLSPVKPDAEHQAKIDEQMAFLKNVVRDEDYYTGNRIQRSIKTGAKKDVLFGRNEGGGQRFHSWVEALIHTDDSNLATVLGSKIGPEVK